MKRLINVMALLICAVFILSSCEITKSKEHVCEYGEWEEIRRATCTSSGLEERYCSCGEKQSKNISAKGHELNSSGTRCMNCGERFDEEEEDEDEDDTKKPSWTTEIWTEKSTEAVTGPVNSEIGDPNEYSYSYCNETVYVNNPSGAITLRTETYEAKGSIAHGTSLQRIGLSTDADNYWSKVIYNEETYYVATRFLTTYNINNTDDGFVAVEKTVVVSDDVGALNVRNLPSFEGQIIGWAAAGEQIKVVAENTTTGWYKIDFTPYGSTEKTYGYIKSDSDYFVQ